MKSSLLLCVVFLSLTLVFSAPLDIEDNKREPPCYLMPCDGDIESCCPWYYDTFDAVTDAPDYTGNQDWLDYLNNIDAPWNWE